MERLRYGIIGLGVQGSLYAGILSGKLGPMTLPTSDKVELTAVSTRSAEALRKLPEGVSPRYFADWREMLRSDSCDAVVITVPHFQHPEIAVYALEQGKHVLCEKPAGIRTSEVRTMVEAEEKSTASLAMMFNNRARPVYERCRELAISGELGTFRHVTWIINTFWRPDTYYRENAWRGTWHGEGGGMLVNQLAHQLDLLLWLCGEPAALRSVLRTGRYRDIDVENEITLRVDFSCGATGELCANGYDPYGINRLELSFSKGKLILEDGARLQILRYRQDETEWNRELTFKTMASLKRSAPEQLATAEIFAKDEPFFEPYARIFENLADHVKDGAPLIASAADGLREVQLANCIYLSDWTGKEIAFPGDEAAFDRLLKDQMS